MVQFGGGGIGSRIENAFGQARGEVNRGTAQAADFLRQGYEDLFRSRAEGMLGGFGEMSSRVGAQTASQGLSPDVVQRMLFAPGQELQMGLGAASGEAASGLNFDLAELFKGAGSELAGLTRDQMAMWVQKEIAKRAAKAGKTAGIISGIGGVVGGGLAASGGGGGAA